MLLALVRTLKIARHPYGFSGIWMTCIYFSELQLWSYKKLCSSVYELLVTTSILVHEFCHEFVGDRERICLWTERERQPAHRTPRSLFLLSLGHDAMHDSLLYNKSTSFKLVL
jgi:hypothetical protein